MKFFKQNKMKYIKMLSLSLSLLPFCGMQAKVILPAMLSDNMVLQQKSQVRLWGTTTHKNGKVKVTASWNSKMVKQCQSDGNGRFELTIQTPPAGYTAYTLTFDDGEKTTVKNILSGEVWLASGQSNMEMPMKGFDNCPVEGNIEMFLKAGEQKGVRFFTVPRTQSYEPKEECGGDWKLSTIANVPDFSATAYYFATTLSRTLNVPVGIVNCSFGGSRIESWMPKELLEKYPDIDLSKEAMEKVINYKRPMLMYNAMLRPVEKYTYKGIIWYQGESNVGLQKDFVQRLSDMVALWRKEMKQGNLPFYTVEIAPYQDYGGSGAYLREAQNKAARVIPNAAIVSTSDLVKPYEAHQIHPCQKQKVGERLSLLALNKLYGFSSLPCEGPVYKSMQVQGHMAELSFENAGEGFSRNSDIEGFEVAGADRVFYPADTVYVKWQTHTLMVASSKVASPIAVRYCFKDFAPGKLAGHYGLPVVPFRTDNW